MSYHLDRTSARTPLNRKGSTKDRLPALPGTAALVLTLGCGRWGNYLTLSVPPIPGGLGLGSGPPYLLDLLVAGALLRILLNGGQRISRTSVASVFGFLLWFYVLFRFLLAGGLDFTALRDFAPYAYVILVPLSAIAVANATTDQLKRTADWVYASLIFHAAWVGAVIISPAIFDWAPTLSDAPLVKIFDLRSDFDAACCAVLAAVTAFKILSGHKTVVGRHGAALILGVSTAVGVHSRVGLIALVVLAPLIAIALAHSKRAVTLVILSVPVVAMLALFVVPNTTAGQRLLLQQVSPANAQAGAGSQGTTDARFRAWEAVYDYTRADPQRSAVGVGFGPDFMSSSGGLTLLVGQDRREEVRSPHSFVVGTYARLGAVGILLFAGLLLPILWRLRRALRHDRGGLESQAAMAVVALGIASLVGVILESPFGAVPFYWFAGAILGLSSRPAEVLCPEGDASGRSTRVT